MASFPFLLKARDIELAVFDVDGVFTTGALSFSNAGEELKTFDVKDGLGIKLLRDAGIKVAVITGRQSHIVEKRMHALGVDVLLQGREDKGSALAEVCAQLHIALANTVYMGDDWPDLSAFALAGLRVAVADAHEELKKRADLVTQRSGGQGAVRELCDVLLHAQGKYDALLNTFLIPNRHNDGAK